jgi:hypothetical protein
MKEYIIHGTQIENLIKILQDGYINNKPLKKDIIVLQDKPSNQIFTQLVYKDIPNQTEQHIHWWTCAIVLDKQLLKDYPFYATRIGGFSDKFENSKTNEETIIYGDGNLTRMPNLTKLKNVINKRMKRDNLYGDEFIHSHEILFNQKIPLDKYCITIIMRWNKTYYGSKLVDKLIKLSKEQNISIKFRDDKLRGKNEKPIDNFIDSIESD